MVNVVVRIFALVFISEIDFCLWCSLYQVSELYPSHKFPISLLYAANLVSLEIGLRQWAGFSCVAIWVSATFLLGWNLGHLEFLLESVGVNYIFLQN